MNERIFQVVLVVLLCSLISMGTIFSGGMFQSIAVEGGLTGANETATVTAHEQVSAWVYIIALLLIIAVLVLAFRLFRDTATS